MIRRATTVVLSHRYLVSPAAHVVVWWKWLKHLAGWPSGLSLSRCVPQWV